MADDPTTPKPLTLGEKTNWNKFIQFVADQKMTNNPVLDQRNKQVGMSLLQKFNYANPKYALSTDIVPRVQSDIQNYRNGLIQQWKAGKLASDAKSEDEIMPNISPVDSWPGTKTLSTRFPIAAAGNTDGTTTNFGTDVAAYDKARGLVATK